MAGKLYFIVAFICVVPVIYACNEAICASVVSKCMLTQSCKCDLKDCSCCKDCFNCLSYLYSECCSCVGKIFHYIMLKICLRHVPYTTPRTLKSRIHLRRSPKLNSFSNLRMFYFDVLCAKTIDVLFASLLCYMAWNSSRCNVCVCVIVNMKLQIT